MGIIRLYLYHFELYRLDFGYNVDVIVRYNRFKNFCFPFGNFCLKQLQLIYVFAIMSSQLAYLCQALVSSPGT